MTRFVHPHLKIRTEMYRCGFTVETLSEATEISVPVLRELLSGRTSTISIRNLCALSRVFGYSTADFIDLLAADEI